MWKTLTSQYVSAKCPIIPKTWIKGILGGKINKGAIFEWKTPTDSLALNGCNPANWIPLSEAPNKLQPLLSVFLFGVKIKFKKSGVIYPGGFQTPKREFGMVWLGPQKHTDQTNTVKTSGGMTD